MRGLSSRERPTRLFITRAVCDEETVVDDRAHKQKEEKEVELGENFLSVNGPSNKKRERAEEEQERKKKRPPPHTCLFGRVEVPWRVYRVSARLGSE